MNKITIKTYPRLHISLIAMNNGIYRKNGGIGFSIDEPNLIFNCSINESFSIEDKREYPFSKNELDRISKILIDLSNQFKFKNKMHIVINSDLIPTHCGFGTSTSARLAILEALFILNNTSYTNDMIVKYSKRGNTSGIGVNTYFSGGYVFDIGTKQDNNELMPSSIEKYFVNPLVILKDEMPNWEFGICIPKKISSLTENEEINFFKKTCPISDTDVYKALYHIIYGLIGGIKEKNLNTFSKAIKEIQNCRWKSEEKSLYGNQLKLIEDKLYKLGALCVGMSSLGPLLFFTSNDINSLVNSAKNEITDCIIFKSDVRNKGRKIIC
ncbi:hypothetical protein PT502_02280 [Aliarcobacter butzleri]|uniref:beta-ribofuranosylaminobenzene 5'-phosphate synthase family protein n=1 Tax=Aliarcobacter butzleri TaxID=28197 RepID=UPI0024DE170E|nr:beta-ribofuranosylaminobenzene 5'-phosphate synthase family protein [Aliarcobacter butzleri]MDK2082617.1 hypothetical protein [Aliarcobacter butzleri]